MPGESRKDLEVSFRRMARQRGHSIRINAGLRHAYASSHQRLRIPPSLRLDFEDKAPRVETSLADAAPYQSSILEGLPAP